MAAADLAKKRAEAVSGVKRSLHDPLDEEEEGEASQLTLSSAETGGPASALDAVIARDKALATQQRVVHDDANSKYSWGRDSNMEFNYDLNEAAVIDAAGGGSGSTKSGQLLAPSNCGRLIPNVLSLYNFCRLGQTSTHDTAA